MKNYFRIFLVSILLIFTQSSYAASNDILLGPGDVLKISVFEQPDLSLEVRVSESGVITFPLIGEVGVGGGTTVDAERKIATLLEKGGYLKNPHVSIIVSQLQSQQVSVLGQVNRPGRYPIDGVRTVADVLALAAGITADGGDEVTIVSTKNGEVIRNIVDIAEIMRTGDLKSNTQIFGGDIVFVDRAKRFYIYGEVQRPGQFRLEHNMTVLQALAVGGGLSPRGTERGIKVKRLDSNNHVEIIKVKHDDLLLPNDIVYVQESLF